MGLELFGIKFNGGHDGTGKHKYTSKIEYKVSRVDLLKALGFKPEDVVFINYGS